MACASLIKPCSRVLVAGGTGTVGSGVVQALLKLGAKVIVGTRCMENFNALADTVPPNLKCSLSAVVGDVRTEDGAKSVFEQVTGDCSGVQHVVATLKGCKTMWACGRMWDQSLSDFYDGSAEEVTGHFLLMRSFLPYLEKVSGSTYTILTGYPLTECPQPGVPNSLVCLASGTVRGLADGARAEHSDSCVAVNEVYLKCTVYKQLDCEVSSLGAMHLGHDLVGSAVTAIAGAGPRREVIINCRDDAVNWTTPGGGASSQFTCPPPCPPPQHPTCGR